MSAHLRSKRLALGLSAFKLPPHLRDTLMLAALAALAGIR